MAPGKSGGHYYFHPADMMYNTRPVAESSDKLVCGQCGTVHDPQFRYCLQCGAKLPEIEKPSEDTEVEPTGVDHGIEPDKDSLYDEPSYKVRSEDVVKTRKSDQASLPVYLGGEEPDEDTEEKPRDIPPPKKTIAALFIIFSFLLPPVGILITIVEAIAPSYRKIIMPTVAALVIGGGIWGWAYFATEKVKFYHDPYIVLMEYSEAQNFAMESSGHYMPLLELRIQGYLPAEFPHEGHDEISIIEHVIGPTGWIVEVKHGDEEAEVIGLESLWADNTGEIRLGSLDGPRYEPDSQVMTEPDEEPTDEE